MESCCDDHGHQRFPNTGPAPEAGAAVGGPQASQSHSVRPLAAGLGHLYMYYRMILYVVPTLVPSLYLPHQGKGMGMET